MRRGDRSPSRPLLVATVANKQATHRRCFCRVSGDGESRGNVNNDNRGRAISLRCVTAAFALKAAEEAKR
jgi:hypothetical protein